MDDKEPIRSLKGVGEKTEKSFAKLGIRTTGDLLRYYPREYDTYKTPVHIGEIKAGEKAAVMAALTFPVEMRAVKKADSSDDNGTGCNGKDGTDLV